MALRVPGGAAGQLVIAVGARLPPGVHAVAVVAVPATVGSASRARGLVARASAGADAGALDNLDYAGALDYLATDNAGARDNQDDAGALEYVASLSTDNAGALDYLTSLSINDDHVGVLSSFSLPVDDSGSTRAAAGGLARGSADRGARPLFLGVDGSSTGSGISSAALASGRASHGDKGRLVVAATAGSDEAHGEVDADSIKFSKDLVLQIIRDFHPEENVTETFLVCKEKALLELVEKELIRGASLLEECMMVFPPGPKNYQALATIGKELKLAAFECQKGYLQSETLERAVAAIKRLRATSMEVPEDSLERFELEIRVRLPQRPRPGSALDEQAVMTYFILMSAYTHSVMRALADYLLARPATDDY